MAGRHQRRSFRVCTHRVAASPSWDRVGSARNERGIRNTDSSIFLRDRVNRRRTRDAVVIALGAVLIITAAA